MAQAYLAPASNSMLRRVEFRRRAAWKVPPSLIPRQLAASPMLVFPRRVEHAFDVAVQRSHHTYPRKHGWPSQFHDQQQTFDCDLPLIELLVGLRKLGDVSASVFEGDEIRVRAY